MSATVWAAYAGTATGSEITLHESKREALEAVVSALGLDFSPEAWAPTSEDDDDHERGPLSDYDDDQLIDEIDGYCSTRAEDWHVEEVYLPGMAAVLDSCVSGGAK